MGHDFTTTPRRFDTSQARQRRRGRKGKVQRSGELCVAGKFCVRRGGAQRHTCRLWIVNRNFLQFRQNNAALDAKIAGRVF